MIDLNFRTIAQHLGSQQTAFEEFCCQIAAKNRPAGSSFARFHGAGGDGGVESVATLSDGSVIGWQAKYVFDVDSLLSQVSKSLETALTVHKTLSSYIVCFPFDLSGPTARKIRKGTPTKGGAQKFDEWAAEEIANAKAAGRTLKIEKWDAHELTMLVFKHDVSGGMRYYFFSTTTLTPDWFDRHVKNAITSAGPRYTASLSLQTRLAQWFTTFEAEAAWRTKFIELIGALGTNVSDLARLVKNLSRDPAVPKWPAALDPDGQSCLASCDALVAQAGALTDAPTEAGFNLIRTNGDALKQTLARLGAQLRSDFRNAHGQEADSKGFREFMASYQMQFPAAHLDATNDTRQTLSRLLDWLASPSGFLAFRRTFVLSGTGGSGKTHGICDVALHRLEKGAFTCIVFGHQFGGEPDPWTRLAESLGLPHTLGKDGVLDALDAAATASAHPLILCLDAINETRPRNYWLHRVAAFAADLVRRPSLKLCVSCRTSFLDVCLPADLSAQAVEHEGFVGMERAACNAFFAHYGLEAPLVPILQPELANPLYLKLVCQTLKQLGLTQLPSGWHGLAPVINAFIDAKEEQFAADHAVSKGAAIVRGSLSAIASAIATSTEAGLAWSQAETVIGNKRPQAKSLQVVDWLVRADLLIEDGPGLSSSSFGGESVVRPAFERFGDFLVAAEMLAQPAPFDVTTAFIAGGPLHRLCSSEQAVGDNAGVLAALSVLVPETFPGLELPNLLSPGPERDAVSRQAIFCVPWRTPSSFTNGTAALIRAALKNTDMAWDAMDSLLAVSTQPSIIDAFWFDALLRALPLAKRDAFWSSYLQERFERSGNVLRLIEAAQGIDLARLDAVVAERWCVVLLWFTAAADRRVKDLATRAAVAISRAQPDVVIPLVDRFLSCGDDEVRERVLLVAYGSLLLSRHTATLTPLAESLLKQYQKTPSDFQNALIRDHIRCIAELARECGGLPAKYNPLIPTTRRPRVALPKPPSAAKVEKWEKLNRGTELISHSSSDDDFNHYSISCLGEWMHAMDKPAIGGWVFARTVTEFNYPNSTCSDYDETLTSQTGGGRSKPAWAERIGKKYQWMALFQLASRLFDSVERKADSWTRVTGLAPLILQEERKMDPTFTRPGAPERSSSDCWWLPRPVDLAASKHLPDSAWVEEKSNIPPLDGFLKPVVHEGRTWITLESYPKWTTPEAERVDGAAYRWTWINLNSFLVPADQFDDAVSALSGRNFWDKWLPEGASWLHVFAGEYPWGSACNIEADDWLGFSDKVRKSSAGLTFIPVSNEIVEEWQYDGSLPHSVHMHVPGRHFFKAGDMRWDGVDGFCTADGTTVFRDPAASEGGPASLIADLSDLRSRLDKLKLRLVWTFLGEKTLLRDNSNKSNRVTYSQIAYLNTDGTIGVGERTHFTDFQKDIGLGPISRKKAK